MKFTKLMALALALLMTVAVFAACGGDPADTTTEAPETTEAPDSTPETTEPDSGCKHAGKKTGNNKDASCTEEGYIEYKCSKCDEFYYKPLEKLPHTYGEFKSVDGKYTKKVCVECKHSEVLDEAGEAVADASAITFPIFAATFEGIEELKDVEKMFDGFTMTPTMANIVKTDPTGELYLNIPSGNVREAANGCLDLTDVGAQLVGKAFTLEFQAFYDEAPAENTSLLTWTVGDKTQVLLSGAVGNKYLDATGKEVAESPNKGWDSFKVEFTASGDYTIYLNGDKISTGKVATSGSTSVFRFFDNKSQFEAYLDTIVIYK